MKIVVAVVLALSFLLFPVLALADTGTYRITDYKVILDPQSDGSVNVDYSQTWLVTGGGIPWITIGTPNNNFMVLKSGGDVTKAYSSSYGSWSGVRLDLKRNYTSGQTFDAQLSIKQKGLLEKLPQQKKWRISFTPGWYDNCKIDKLTIVLNSHSDNLSYGFNPLPTMINEFNQVVWERDNLNNGERFTVNMESTDGKFMGMVEENVVDSSSATGVASASPKKTNSDDGIMWFLLVIFGGVLLAVIIGAFKVYGKYRDVEDERDSIRKEIPRKSEEEIDRLIVQRRKKKEQEEEEEEERNRHVYIPYISPIISVGSHGVSSPHTGGGHSDGGGASGSWESSSCVASSCACACVSCACACACACAGGGAAGCTNKFNIKKEAKFKMRQNKCAICEKELRERQGKYCSVSCANKGRKRDGIWRDYVIVPRQLLKSDEYGANK